MFYHNIVGRMDEDCWEDTGETGYALASEDDDCDPFQQQSKYLGRFFSGSSDEDRREMVAERVARDTGGKKLSDKAMDLIVGVWKKKEKDRLDVEGIQKAIHDMKGDDVKLQD